ncbi:MAG TPA: ATP-binding protein, partial [Planctomycetota bacterium]|nr:ATP-binding protein [Planctomycetota bacterium]
VEAELRRSEEELRKAAQERQFLLEAERTARAEAERVSFMKDEFLATLSHELRTPLNAIVGWSQVLRSRPTLDSESLEGLAIIDRNAKLQAQLIEDLLDMSRINSGKVRLDVERVDILDIVKAAIASVRHAAESKGLELHGALDPYVGPVWGDPRRLQQCVSNLLSNAIKFTPRSGRIEVTLARIGSNVGITVADNGQGIAPEFLPHVFERFRQADASTTRFHGGLGLGLSIVKSIVEMHGGRVSATSPGLGKGASFRVELPVMVFADPLWQRPRRDATTSSASPAIASLKGITVLAVDDEPDARGLIKRILEDCGARVLVADSALHALIVIREERPDVLLSDLSMPAEDGYALIRQVRLLDREHGRDTPAAALSALARPEDRALAIEAGYQAHLSKPVQPTELSALVATLARSA